MALDIRASVALITQRPAPPPARPSKHRRQKPQSGLTISRDIAVDAALAVAATVYSLLQPLVFLPIWRTAYAEPDSGGPSGAMVLAISVVEILASFSILTRRRLPLVLAAFSLADLWLGGAGITYPIAVYTLVVRARCNRWAVATGVAGATVPIVDFVLISGERPPVLLFVQDAALGYLLPMLVAPALVAITVRTHRKLIRTLRRRAEHLKREQELAARNARLEERARIARDMHDVVAHYVGLIVIQAGALEISAAAESEERKSAELLGSLGRRAMGELRDLLGVLRSDDGEVLGGGEGDAPDGAEAVGTESWQQDVAALVNEVRRVGVLVRCQLSGERESVGVPAQRAAYRVVQEGIANAVRHAPGAEVRVRVAVSAQYLDVSVRNGPPPGPVTVQTMGGGHGLIGMRERVAMMGGTVRAFATPAGGFSLSARIPSGVAPGDPGAAGASASPPAAVEPAGPSPPGETDDPGSAGGRRGAGASGHPSRARVG